ncbi:hypothetical protein HPB49_000305 [Dermacentor silvarum]|uniref:Uncharacterized protein n=1 Tax=Dermacentor silvarum TaxID=543639 RepID=A0ACB8DSK7_DERSI|nr:hypothetical protein HPB49_000305 [Dermacentor silvarum]
MALWPRARLYSAVAPLVTALLESGCNDRTAFSKVLDKLIASRDKLQNINAELDDVIAVDDLETYENAGHQERVLGMGWSKDTDAFIYNPENIVTFLEKAKDPKRFGLPTASRIYDTLGFLAPYVVRGKMLFQHL